MTAAARPYPPLRIRTPRVEIEDELEGPNEKRKYVYMVQRVITRLGSCFFTTGLLFIALFAVFWRIWFLNIGLVCFIMAFIFHKSAEFDADDVAVDIEQGN